MKSKIKYLFLLLLFSGSVFAQVGTDIATAVTVPAGTTQNYTTVGILSGGSLTVYGTVNTPMLEVLSGDVIGCKSGRCVERGSTQS